MECWSATICICIHLTFSHPRGTIHIVFLSPLWNRSPGGQSMGTQFLVIELRSRKPTGFLRHWFYFSLQFFLLLPYSRMDTLTLNWATHLINVPEVVFWILRESLQWVKSNCSGLVLNDVTGYTPHREMKKSHSEVKRFFVWYIDVIVFVTVHPVQAVWEIAQYTFETLRDDPQSQKICALNRVEHQHHQDSWDICFLVPPKNDTAKYYWSIQK